MGKLRMHDILRLRVESLTAALHKLQLKTRTLENETSESSLSQSLKRQVNMSRLIFTAIGIHAFTFRSNEPTQRRLGIWASKSAEASFLITLWFSQRCCFPGWVSEGHKHLNTSSSTGYLVIILIEVFSAVPGVSHPPPPPPNISMSAWERERSCRLLKSTNGWMSACRDGILPSEQQVWEAVSHRTHWFKRA